MTITPTRQFTKDEVVDALKTVVESKPPDWRNPMVPGSDPGEVTGGRYVGPDGSPSCIIGNLLSVLDLPLPAWEDRTNDIDIESLVSQMHLYPFDDEVLWLLDSIQAGADSGWSWSNCLKVTLSADTLESTR